MIGPDDFIRYESGTLDGQERVDFEKALAADAEALRYWLAQRQMDEALRAAQGGESRARLQRSILEVISSAGHDEMRQRVLFPMAREAGRRRALLGLAALAAAACVALIAWVSMDHDVARVLTASNCKIEREGASRPATQGFALRPNDKLVVADQPAGAMTFEYRDASRVTLQSGARVTLALGERGGKRIALRQGSLTARVSKQPRGAPMILQTPEAVLTVVGTEFALAADDGQTQLRVKEGLVRMARPDGSNVQNVAAGQSMVFLPDSIHPAAPAPGSTYGQGVNAQTGKRIAFLWPFATKSIWNRPVGSQAHYARIEPAGWLASAAAGNGIAGRPILMEVRNFPEHRVLVAGAEAARARLPDKFRPGFAVHWPVIVIVDPYTSRVMELRGADRLPDGDLAAGEFAIHPLGGAGDQGLTAAGVSAMGGVIRFGELTGGIPHALAIAVSKDALGGNVQPGGWLAIPPSVDTAQFQGVKLELARAFQDYGACIVDIGDAPLALYVWYENLPADFPEIVRQLVPLLEVVTGRDAGTPRRQSAPPIQHEN